MTAETRAAYPLEPVAPADTVESQVYARLRSAIINGKLAPGERLVLTRLATDLGVSRVPVTQALKRLEVEGFVTTNERNEIVVVQLSAEDVWEIYTLRAVLQPLAARHAAKRATPEQIAVIEKVEKEIFEQLSQGKHRNEWHFHAAVAAASNMPRLIQILHNLWDHTKIYHMALETEVEQMEQVRKREDAELSQQEHLELLEALRHGDEDKAAAVEERQVLRGMARVMALPIVRRQAK